MTSRRMGRVAGVDGQGSSVLLGGVACGLVLLSALGCGGLADHRRGAPMGMSGVSGGSSSPPVAGCNPRIESCGPALAGGSGPMIRRETCADNPFLAECPQPPRPLPPEPQPMPPEPTETEVYLPVAAAENVLAANCGQCHGSLPELADSIQGGLGDIQDFEALRQAGYIVDCAAESSRIIQVMGSGSMPPPSSGLPQVNAADVEVVAYAIEWGCTDVERSCAGDPALPGCGVVLAERALERNCGACHGARARMVAPGGFVENMSDIDDMAKLIENDNVVPCRPDRSSVLVRARDGSMPPPPSRVGPNGSAFSPRDDAAVLSFIEGLCPGPASPEDTEQLRVEELLGTYCGDCHGQRAVELGQVQGGIDDIESVDGLIRTGRLVPCYSEGSPIIQQLRDGSMPPPASPQPLDAEIQLIADFVERPCVGP